MFKEFFEKYIYKYYKYIVVSGVIVLCLILGVFYLSHNSRKINKEEKRFTANIIKEDKTSSKKEIIKYFYVDIKGEVVTPNVYKVEEGSRIIDVVNLAGGLKKDANTTVLNLSKKIVDEMLIIIYSNDEINKLREGDKSITEIIQIVEKECVCPDPQINDACHIKGKISDKTTKVNINNASIENLMTLPGIGESKAKNIVNYRLENGDFTTIEDIKNVTGIGDSVFDQIKDYLTL